MIRREADGSTLYFAGPDGAFVRVSIMDSQYSPVLDTFGLQISARLQNNHNLDIYKQKVANAQISIDASRNPGPLPEKITKIVVSDPSIDEYGTITAGIQTEEVWIGLPEVKQK
jgi:hypothetical protein